MIIYLSKNIQPSSDFLHVLWYFPGDCLVPLIPASREGERDASSARSIVSWGDSSPKSLELRVWFASFLNVFMYMNGFFFRLIGIIELRCYSHELKWRRAHSCHFQQPQLWAFLPAFAFLIPLPVDIFFSIVPSEIGAEVLRSNLCSSHQIYKRFCTCWPDLQVISGLMYTHLFFCFTEHLFLSISDTVEG